MGGIFGNVEPKAKLMEKRVSLDEILEEERQIRRHQRERCEENKHSKQSQNSQRIKRAANQNPYDTFAKPSSNKLVKDPVISTLPKSLRLFASKVPGDEVEAAALAAYYTAYSRGLQKNRMHLEADDRNSSRRDLSSCCQHSGGGHGSAVIDRYGNGGIPPSPCYPYRTGVRGEKIPPLESSIPSAYTPQFIPVFHRPQTTENGSDPEVVCIGSRVSTEVPLTPKIKHAIPILIIDDDDVDTDVRMDT